jgi:hypothetical protein
LRRAKSATARSLEMSLMAFAIFVGVAGFDICLSVGRYKTLYINTIVFYLIGSPRQVS